MKYYFVLSSISDRKKFDLPTIKNNPARLLISYAMCRSANIEPMLDLDMMVDSGAFSAWSRGVKIDISEYREFLTKLPKHWVKASLDVIPPVNATTGEKAKCCDQGMENFLFLQEKIPEILPTFHIGENYRYLKRIMDHTDFIGMGGLVGINSPKKKTEFIRECFKVSGFGLKYHIFGQGSITPGIWSNTIHLKYPFFSCDSTSYYRVLNPYTRAAQMWTAPFAVYYLTYQKVEAFRWWERFITDLWRNRGIEWK